MPAEPKSPLDQALDALVFAPVGLALTARDELPQLAEKGRQRISGQLLVARMIGQFAVTQGQREAEKAAGRLVEQAGSVAGRLGGLPGKAGQRTAARAPETARDDAPTAASNGSSGSAASASPATGNVTASRVPAIPTPPAAPSASSNTVARTPDRTPARQAPPTDTLAIPGYDSLSASQVVQRLAGLSAVELEAIRRYEEATRGRRTVLSKVAQLQADRS